jgi:phosphate transport system permease protein
MANPSVGRPVDSASPWYSRLRSVAVTTPDSPTPVEQQPRAFKQSRTFGDRVFRGLSGGAAATCLVIMAATGIFLTAKALPALSAVGPWQFLTGSDWRPDSKQLGVGGLLVDTVIIATVALVIAVPLALGLALFINEYAPARVKRLLTSAVDLLAAIPSLIFGMWGFFALQEPLIGIAQWLSTHLNALPFFRLTSADQSLAQSSFIAGAVVALMATPIITSVSRDVMAQCPRVQCEGALALGGSRWGMIRDVILPFGRSGIVGSILLGFGRALGETIAVVLLISLIFEANPYILTQGSGSISALIATKFGEAQGLEVNGLIAAGLALFIMTLVVNLIARAIVRRSQIEA